MIILAIETASQSGSVAIRIGDEVHQEDIGGQQQQSERILLAIDRCLAARAIPLDRCDAVAVGKGPGSFTGLRVGMGVAQGLAYGSGRPLVTVSSLQALAQSCSSMGTPVLAIIDARMDEVYWGCFAADAEGWMQPRGRAQVSPPEAVRVARAASQWRVAGNGWKRYRDRFTGLARGVSIIDCGKDAPQAREVAALAAHALAHGAGVSPLQAHPEYLRDDVATPGGITIDTQKPD